ncbi:MAG: YraN family protein [Verrucomicrobiota bacterium]
MRHALGRRGEAIAACHLRRLGYKVLYHNYRAPHGGEVDLVCRDRDTLVFVEVKTRTSEAFGAPAEAVTPAKQRLIARGALAWLKLLGNREILYRFDIVEVRIAGRQTGANVIRNAFTLPEPYRH